MKILIICDIYPSEENPISGIFIKEQVKHLKKYHDLRVMVITRRFVRICIKSFIRYIFEKIFYRKVIKDKKNKDGIIKVEYPVFS